MKQISAFVKNIGTPNKNDLSTDEEEQQQGQKQRHDGSSECSETIGSEVDDNVNVVNVLDPPITVGKEGGILTAVRIRPLNTREIGSNSRIIVSNPGFMSQGIQIINPIFFKSSNQTEKLRKLEERGFSFDHTFWSLDGGNGVDKDEYASQEDIYDRIGKPIIQHAMSGFNCSLFAYGQTGSGKTFTMMGKGAATATSSADNEVDSDDDSDTDLDDYRRHGQDGGQSGGEEGRDRDRGAGIIPRLCKDLLAEVTLLKSLKSHSSHPSSLSTHSIGREKEKEKEERETQREGQRETNSTEQVIEAHMRAAYYEIYNEKLYDLLAEDYEVPRKVREHAVEGAYVEGLTYSLIQTYEDIERILLAGQEKRQTAETKMNAESSRSHAIFVIQIAQKIDIRSPTPTPTPTPTGKSDPSGSKSLTQKLTQAKRKSKGATAAAVTVTSQVIERNSKICLIDLAGSERLNTTGATGDRLKEATNINSSLSTLGEVIRKLSDKGKNNKNNNNNSGSEGKMTTLNGEQDASFGNVSNSGSSSGSGSGSVHVPYRNSILTWILKDSLGGNSKTAIVATVSPSEASYSESLSTLRYLERAKFVETNAVINENNSQDPYIKHLQHQLSAFKIKLNTALSQIRQQERQHKSALSEITEELEMMKSQEQHKNNDCHDDDNNNKDDDNDGDDDSSTPPHTPTGTGSGTGSGLYHFNRMSAGASAGRGSFNEGMAVLKQMSRDNLDLSVTLGSESESERMDSGRWGSSHSLGGHGGEGDEGEGEGHDRDRDTDRGSMHRFSRSPSKRSLQESRGRTKEYFENECYDLQDALARSMAECNSLRERLTEVEDLHDIEVEILTEELQSIRAYEWQSSTVCDDNDSNKDANDSNANVNTGNTVENGDNNSAEGLGIGGAGVMEESNVISLQHKESINNLQVAIERLQMRLHEKDLDLLAEKTLAQETLEINNQLLFNLECEKDELQKTIRSGADSHDSLLSDYNELAIRCAKVNSEKNTSLDQQDSLVADLRGEIEVLSLVIASKEEIIVMHTQELSRKETENDKQQSNHEDELNSMREVMNMYKKEIVDRDERLSEMDTVLAGMKEDGSGVDFHHDSCSGRGRDSGGGGGKERSLLEELEDVSSQPEDEDEEKKEDEEGSTTRYNQSNSSSSSSSSAAALAVALADRDAQESLVEEYKVRINALEQELDAVKQTLGEEREGHALFDEDCRARFIMLEKEKEIELKIKEDKEQEMLLQTQQFEEKIDVMLQLVAAADRTREEAEMQHNHLQETVQGHESTLRENDTHIEELEMHLLEADEHLDKLVHEWEAKEDHFEKVIHTLTDEIEVLEVDNTTKNACLELFESQLVTQENELKSSQCKHEEEVNMLKVDAEVVHIYLTAKEENIEALESQLVSKTEELNRILADQQLIEEGLTIELASFKLALAGKEESHAELLEEMQIVKEKSQKELVTKLEQAQQRVDTIEAEGQEDRTALVMESEILKQDINLKDISITELRQSIADLTDSAEASNDIIAQKNEHIDRLTTVDIPRLQQELLTKEQECEANVQQSEHDRNVLEQANNELQAELTARRELDATVPGKKSKFICF